MEKILCPLLKVRGYHVSTNNLDTTYQYRRIEIKCKNGKLCNVSMPNIILKNLKTVSFPDVYLQDIIGECFESLHFQINI